MAWKIVKAVTPQAGYWDLIGLFCKTPESEFNTSGHLHSLPNVIVEVERPCEANLPLSVGHFTQQRWDRFLKDYTDEKLPDFLKACLWVPATAIPKRLFIRAASSSERCQTAIFSRRAATSSQLSGGIAVE